MSASSTFKQPEMSAAKVVVKPPKVPCFRCQKSHDSPAAFLMACWKCGRAWHHICHIPPVSEEEILRRIDADKGGMPDLGLRTWQCRKCTKKRQLEPSPGAPQPPPQKPCLTRETTPQPSPWKAESKPPHIPIPIDDDDIIILDGPPAAPSGQAIAKPPNLPPPVPVPVPASISTQADKAQPVGDVSSSETILKKAGLPALYRARKQATRSPSAQSFLPPTRPQSAKSRHTPRAQEDVPKSPQPTAEPSLSLPSPPPTPAIPPVPSRSSTHPSIDQPQSLIHTPPPPSPARAATSARSPSVTVVSIAAPRAHIAKMREQGRLAAPPTIEYKQSRPADDKGKGKARASPSSNDSELDVMAVDGQSALGSAALLEVQPSVATEEEDPHNIDDLYGEIAPRFRSVPAPIPGPAPSLTPRPALALGLAPTPTLASALSPASVLAPAPAPPVQARPRRAAATRLPFLDRDKKPVSDDDEMEYICTKLARIEKHREEEEAPRRPRKCVATKLVGKKLKKTQERTFNYCVRVEAPRGRDVVR